MLENKEEIISNVCEKIKDMSVAIFHNGSSAVGLQTKKSDIDLVVIVNDITDRDSVVKMLSSFFPFYEKIYESGNHNGIYECVAYMVDGVKLDIAFFIKEAFLNYTNSFYDSIANYRKHVSRIKHKIIDAKEVYDPLHMFQEAVLKVGKYPSEFKKELIKDLLDEINYHIDYISFSGLKNRYESQFVARDIIKPACIAIYALHDSFFMLGYKRLHHDLPRFSPEFMTLLDSFLENAHTYNVDGMIVIGKKIHDLIENHGGKSSIELIKEGKL